MTLRSTKTALGITVATVIGALTLAGPAQAVTTWDFTYGGNFGFDEENPGTDIGFGPGIVIGDTGGTNEHNHTDLAAGTASGAVSYTQDDLGYTADQMWCESGLVTANRCNMGVNAPIWASALNKSTLDVNGMPTEISIRHVHDNPDPNGSVPAIGGLGVQSGSQDSGDIDIQGPDEVLMLELFVAPGAEEWIPISIEFGAVDLGDGVTIKVGTSADYNSAVEVFSGTLTAANGFILGDGFAGSTYTTDAERAAAGIGTLYLDTSVRGSFLFIESSNTTNGADSGVRVRALVGSLPEPGTIGLLGLGLVGLGALHRRRRKAA